MLQKKNKICLVSDCLSTGGAERVAAFLSIFFVNKGIDIHHVIVQDKVDYEFAGKLLNLGKLKNKNNSIFNKLKRLIIFKKFIQQNNFDFIIDFRVQNHFLQELFISKFIYKKDAIYCVSNYMLDLYFPKNKWLAKIIHSENHRIVAITDGIKQEIQDKYGFENIKKILNPLDIFQIEKLSKEFVNLDFDYIIAAGRMVDNKQFEQLIKSYANSILPENDIKLVFLGDGINKEALQKLSIVLGLENKIVFFGHVDNPYKYFANAKFFVLSSLYEGLPMVLLEALACGRPVISFDCLTGPSEIIIHENNGLLVENQNFNKLAEAMNLMHEDKMLYSKCKENAKNSIQKFSLENIGNQWLEYLNITTN